MPNSSSSSPTSELRVEPLSPDGAAATLAEVEADEASRGASMVDEGELERLRRFVMQGDIASGWQPFVARVGGEGVGYGAVVTTGESATGDAAVRLAASDGPAVLRALLDALSVAATQAQAQHLQVWVRQVGEPERQAATAVGFGVDRSLGVLGRDLAEDLEVIAPGDGWRIRPAQVPADDAAVAQVLAVAYAGTDEAGWDLARLRERQAYDWFRAQDLLVAEGPDGTLGGLHWLKRRAGDEGEVYNLAIAPTAQGAGLGAALLTAGLAHLREVGCERVVLWVDRANARAVRLYEKYGFETCWDDVAFGRDLAG